ncbi:MAG TPA: hypothetical protein PLP51_02230 [Acholeplasmataceae bacterium]|nr:hypothetical protein [Acholeplasmataceae bacterium]
MKKKEIIKLIKDENSQDVEYTYDFDRVAKEVGISSKTVLDRKQLKKYYGRQLFFKYATLSLFFLAILLSGVIIYQVNHPIVIDGPPIEETPTKEQLVAQYFEDQNAKFIATPIKSQVIDGILVNIYMGVLDIEQIIFVYTFENLTIGSSIQITTSGKLESIEGNIDIVDYHDNDTFTSSRLKRENSYQIAINIDINEQIKNMIIELDVTQFLAYLNQ